MPKELEKIRKEIWNSIKGKINPKTKKPYTESDSYAIATSVWKRKQK